MNYRYEAPAVIRDFLVYHETIKGHSKKTVDEYYLDLRNFFRYIKIIKNKAPRDASLEDISISDVDLGLVSSVTLSDVYEYLAFLARDKELYHNSSSSPRGLSASSRARKVVTIRSYYDYLVNKAKLLDVSPVADIDSPKFKKSLPRYLSLDDSIKLLDSVDGNNAVRDYCILTIFLNCGLRISEIIGLNLTDIGEKYLRVLGKGNKERVVFLNDACIAAINDYLIIRKGIHTTEKNALFLSSRKERISRSTVHYLVKEHLKDAGLDAEKYSAHKLRHTAATLMLHNGVDVRTLQELLGHENLNTTQIYTHVESDQLRRAADLSPLGKIKRDDQETHDTSQDENDE